MAKWLTFKRSSTPSVRVLVEHDDGRREELRFTEAFRIGRDPECDVHVDSGLVSRVHAEVTPEDGQWWIRDLGSTNGVFVDGARTIHAPLPDETVLQLGHNAPMLRVWIETGKPRKADASASRSSSGVKPPAPRAPSGSRGPSSGVTPPPARPPRSAGAPPPRSAPPPHATPPPRSRSTPTPPPDVRPPAGQRPTGTPRPPYEGASRPPQAPSGVPSGGGEAFDPSMSQVIRRYFEDDDSQPAGEHTQMIRRAYQTVKQEQERRYHGIILVVLVLLVGALGFGIFQRYQNQRMAEQAAQLFEEVRRQELQIAKFREALEATENRRLEDLLAEAEKRRERMAMAYDGLIEEFGLYRRLNAEEELIYRMARVFNESQFAIPAGFVREVKRTIRDYWQNPSGGKGRFERAIRKAEQNGHIPLIVDRMRAYGLPPEFFYLALQESDLRPDAVGPSTRWGRAKGMWQFIPSTAVRYGLDVGQRADTPYPDPQDDRLDVERASDAAARYLLYIYSTPAQASGLLVMASYNWGEHRVISKLQGMANSEDAINAAFEGIAEDPDERNYWRFLNEYDARMPEETKDYVLKIFSAAVIGQDPRHFGFDFDDPLRPYIERTSASAP